MRRFELFIVLLVSIPRLCAADEQPSAKLTLEALFSRNDYRTKSFDGRWLKDQNVYSTLESSKTVEGGHDIVLTHAETGESNILVSAQELVTPGLSKPLPIDGYSFSDDLSLVLIYTNSRRVWRQKTRGDYWLLDRSARQFRKLGGNAPEASLMFAKISPDSRRVAYVREGDLYVEDIAGQEVLRLTSKEKPSVINGTFDWVYEEELGLRDGFRWSPNGESIAYWQLDTEGVGQVPLVDNTDSLYPRVQWVPYPKVGERNSSSRVGVIPAVGGATRWIQIPGDPRNQYIARMEWAGNAGELVLQVLNRRQNENRVLLGDATSGEAKTVFLDRDAAWVDIHDDFYWIDDGKRFTWISDRDGWQHLYSVPREGGEPQLLTPGEFDVVNVLHAGDASGRAYFLASPGDATRRYLYQVRLDGSELRRVTPVDDRAYHGYVISDDGAFAFHDRSTIDDPPRYDLVEFPSHRQLRTLEDNAELRKKIEALDRAPTEFFYVTIGDGTKLDGWRVMPPKMEEGKKYPLIVYVYGEPAGQTVVDAWRPNHQLWHLFLAQQGYVVLSVDNRGTGAPRGRPFRKASYRNIGIIGPSDQAEALHRILDAEPYLDRTRVGVWGWSGGGSSTLHAMFRYPDLYRVGVSVAPVPNQRYYDTIYQERYMDLPSDNVEGFLQGSPITHAGGLEGDLLIIHGTGDDNCHYQTTEMLIDELIRLNKKFSMMSYPNRTHAIREGENTSLHLRELMTRFFLENLPAGGR